MQPDCAVDPPIGKGCAAADGEQWRCQPLQLAFGNAGQRQPAIKCERAAVIGKRKIGDPRAADAADRLAAPVFPAAIARDGNVERPLCPRDGTKHPACRGIGLEIEIEAIVVRCCVKPERDAIASTRRCVERHFCLAADDISHAGHAPGTRCPADRRRDPQRVDLKRADVDIETWEDCAFAVAGFEPWQLVERRDATGDALDLEPIAHPTLR